MPRRSFAHRVLLTTLVLITVSACTAGPSTRPAIVQDNGAQQPAGQGADQGPAPIPPLEESNSRLNWTDCTRETGKRMLNRSLPDGLTVECAHTIGATDSPRTPGSGVSRIAMLKAGSGKTPLVVLDDANGLPGTLYAAQLAGELPPEMLRTFSLIGVDRRGTGRSDAARCIPEQARKQLVNVDPAATDVEPVLDAAREAGKECAIVLEEQFRSLDSEHAAADLETIRKRLGVNHLNMLTRGEGSRVAGLYTMRHPRHVGRLVLDGVPDPGTNELATAEETAASADATFRAFAEQCTSGNCPIGPDPRRTLSELVDRLREQPISTGNGLTLGPGTALTAVLTGLSQKSRWPHLAEAIDKASGGDGSALARFVLPLFSSDTVGGDPSRAPRLDGSLITRCNDTMQRLPPEQIERTAADWRSKYPVFGGLLANRMAWCSPWSVRTSPLPTPTGKGLPPVLVVSTKHDPVTPERGTARAAANLRTSVRLSWQGAGHGAVGESDCVREAVQGFLVDGRVPHDNTPCPA